MRQFIDILNEAAADYEAMINPVLGALRSNTRTGSSGIAVDLADEWREKITKMWATQVKNAKTDLRKADRITWYLRLVRARIIETFASALDDAKINKVRQDYNSRAGLPIEQDGFYITNDQALITLTHYLSLPIAGITNYQFRFQSYNEVIGDFQQMEDKWKESVKDTLEDDHAKVIVDCGDNWFWVDTEKAYCSKEAAAMGHCGNSPRQNSDDHLLSLRKKIMFGQEVRWQPHLTFILASDGFLTEMKGKNNDKPVEKYHPMIVKLLESDIITGIRGGGYLPENNFAMADLDDATRDRLIEMKPELGTVADLFEAHGVSDLVFDRIMDELNHYGLSCEEYDGDTVVLETWDGMDKFFRNGTYDRDDEALAMMGVDGDFDGWLDNVGTKPHNLHADDNETILDMIFESSDDDVLARIAAKTGTRIENAPKALVHMFPNSLASIWEEVRKEAMTTAANTARSKIQRMRLRCYDESIRVLEDGTVQITMPFRSLAYNIAAYQESDYDRTDGFEYCAQDGSWLSVEDDADEYYGDDEPEEEVTAETIYARADALALEMILELFHDDQQMDFGF